MLKEINYWLKKYVLDLEGRLSVLALFIALLAGISTKWSMRNDMLSDLGMHSSEATIWIWSVVLALVLSVSIVGITRWWHDRNTRTKENENRGSGKGTDKGDREKS